MGKWGPMSGGAAIALPLAAGGLAVIGGSDMIVSPYWGVVLLALSGVVLLVTVIRAWPSKAVPQVPRLKVQFVTNGVLNDDLDYHFVIENLGPGDAEIIRTHVSLPGDMFLSLGKGEVRQMITAGGSLNIPGSPVNRLRSHKALALDVVFEPDEPVRRQFTGRFRFMLGNIVKEGAIDPIASDYSPGNTIEDKTRDGAFERLWQPEGMIMLGLFEEHEGSPNVVGFGCNGRTFEFNPITRVVGFTVIQNGVQKTSTGTLADGLKHQIISLQWNDANETYSLKLNDELVPETDRAFLISGVGYGF